MQVPLLDLRLQYASIREDVPVEPAGRTHVYHQFVIRVPERDVVRALAICPELTSDQQQHVIDSLAECVA